MTSYELKSELHQVEQYNEDGTTEMQSVDVEIPEEAIGVNTTALTTTPMMVGVTYMVPTND